MKVQAIIFSPIISTLPYWILWLLTTINSFSEDWGNSFIIYFIICFVAIIVQLFVEFLLFISEFWVKTTFKIYLHLATTICVIIGFLTFFFISDNYDMYINLSNSIMAFLSFYFYAIGNAFAYNYLYFSKLDKKIVFSVLPTQEGTDFKIDEA